MAHIDFTQFTWFVPKPKVSLAITIPNPNSMNLNPHLMAQIPRSITFGISADGAQICICETEGAGYKIAKSGAVKDKDLIRHILNAGARYPARYSVYKEEDCWLGILDEQPPLKVDTSKKPRKQREDSLQAFEKEAGSL